MLRNTLLLILVPLLCSIYCAKNGRKVPPVSASEEFEKLDLLKRPLNAYIVENGKHAKVEEKSIQIGGGNGMENPWNTVAYNISRPPFAIIQRGAVILLDDDKNGTYWPNWHHGRPSIVQMLAANGHCVVVPELKRGTADEVKRTLREIVQREKLHKLVILGKSIDLTEELVGINDQLDEQLDAIVVLNGTEDLVEKLKKHTSELGTNKGQLQIMLKQKGGEKAAAKGGTEEVKVNTVEAEWESEGEHKGERMVAQLMVNLLDWVHPR